MISAQELSAVGQLGSLGQTHADDRWSLAPA